MVNKTTEIGNDNPNNASQHKEISSSIKNIKNKQKYDIHYHNHDNHS